MVRDLVRITDEEIIEVSKKSVQDDQTVIMYLQNNGDKEHEWNNDDIDVLINEDIDD